MASFELFFPKILKHEGGFVDNPNDRGGATNKGITLAVWQSYGYDKDGDGKITENDLRLITDADAANIYRNRYWRAVMGDKITSQELAEAVADHAINAGAGRAIKILQELVNRTYSKKIPVDGVMSLGMVKTINNLNARVLSDGYRNMRVNYYKYLANSYNGSYAGFFRNSLGVTPRETQKTFLKGWLNRVNGFAITTDGIYLTVLGLFLGLSLVVFLIKDKKK